MDPPAMASVEIDADLLSSWPSSALLKRVKESVRRLPGVSTDAVEIVVSPYRICPIGAHIDHQGGSVTAMALDRGVILGFSPSKDKTIRLVSGQFSGTVEFSLNKVPPARHCQSGLPSLVGIEEHNSTEESRWGDFARGAALALQHKGYRLSEGIIGYLEGSKGFDGGGVSSSAAVGVAFLLALEHVNRLTVSEEDNIELDRLIENDYLGLRIGVLDQSAILVSERHCLSLINCKVQTTLCTLSFQFSSGGGIHKGTTSAAGCMTRKYKIVHPPWYGNPQQSMANKSYKILIAFSGLRHALASKPGYNMRVNECQDAARILLKAVSRESSQEPLLGNVTLEEYTQHKEKLSGSLARRAEHFFTENARVFAGVQAWSTGDLEQFGTLMSASGQSSIDNYECGCEALVQLRQIVLDAPGVLGARFSGAGFRGCCVAFVTADRAQEAASHVELHYTRAHPELVKNIVQTPVAVVCESGHKARIVDHK